MSASLGEIMASLAAGSAASLDEQLMALHQLNELVLQTADNGVLFAMLSVVSQQLRGNILYTTSQLLCVESC
jgi:hypothetical protein